MPWIYFYIQAVFILLVTRKMDKTSWIYSSYVWQGDRRRRTGPEEANLTSEVVHLWSFAPQVHIDGVNPFICSWTIVIWYWMSKKSCPFLHSYYSILWRMVKTSMTYSSKPEVMFRNLRISWFKNVHCTILFIRFSFIKEIKYAKVLPFHTNQSSEPWHLY